MSLNKHIIRRYAQKKSLEVDAKELGERGKERENKKGNRLERKGL